MKIIKLKLNKTTTEHIEVIIDFLKRGKVIVYPTDTVYGLGCLATDMEAVRKISRIKQRPVGQAYLILIDSLIMAKKYAFINTKQEKYLAKIWPGPVTVVLSSRGNLPLEVTGGKDTIAIRLPKSEFLGKIIGAVKVPIISTSVNLSGDENIPALADLEKYFKKDKPDLVIDAGPAKSKKSSRLIDLTDIGNIKILRH